jgi:hypothetical protein
MTHHRVTIWLPEHRQASSITPLAVPVRAGAHIRGDAQATYKHPRIPSAVDAFKKHGNHNPCPTIETILGTNGCTAVDTSPALLTRARVW